MRLCPQGVVPHYLPGANPFLKEFGEKYNVAPTQSVPVVRQDRQGNRTAALLKWGLVPFWADDPSIGNRLINARSEEVATKPAFRAAFDRTAELDAILSDYRPDSELNPLPRHPCPDLYRVLAAAT